MDPSFDMSNFDCANMSETEEQRKYRYSCSLSGTTRLMDEARQLSSGRQSPSGLPGPISSKSASPISSALPGSMAPPARRSPGIYEPIDEIACTVPGGPCFGENGEVGYATRSFGSFQVKKKHYWQNSFQTPLAVFPSISEKQCLNDPNAVHECSATGLQSFSTIGEQACTAGGEPSIDAMEAIARTEGEPLLQDFQFPVWNQLPLEFQDHTTSADSDLSIPATTTGVSMATAGTTSGDDLMPWDDAEMNFNMDMDMDLDMDLDMLGKC